MKNTLLIQTNNKELVVMLRSILSIKKIDLLHISSADDLSYHLSGNNLIAIVIDLYEIDKKKLNTYTEIASKACIPLLFLYSKISSFQKLINFQRAIIMLSDPLSDYAMLNTILNRNTEETKHHIKNNKKTFKIDKGCLEIQNGKKVRLTLNELRIFSLLYENKNQYIPSQKIVEQLDLTSNSSLYVHIRNLRNKIEKKPRQPEFLKSDPRKGYILCAD